jgi:hypothetical protein
MSHGVGRRRTPEPSGKCEVMGSGNSAGRECDGGNDGSNPWAIAGHPVNGFLVLVTVQ